MGNQGKAVPRKWHDLWCMSQGMRQARWLKRQLPWAEDLTGAVRSHAHHPPDLVLGCRIEASAGGECWRQDTHLLLVPCAASFGF